MRFLVFYKHKDASGIFKTVPLRHNTTPGSKQHQTANQQAFKPTSLNDVKVKSVAVHVMKTYGGVGNTAPLK